MDFQRRYMKVNLTLLDFQWRIDGSVGVQEFWQEELSQYPYFYTYMGDRCTWFIHSNIEMTPKLIQVCGEQADRMCAEGAKKNDTRKLANR